MTKILHVVSSVDPALGGVAESIVRRGEKLVEMGHQVEVVSLDEPENPVLKGYPLRLHALGPGITAWCYSRKLIPWLRTHCGKYDAVIVDGIWQFHAFATRQALKGTKTPYFVFTHGMLDPWFKHTYPLKHLKKWMFWPWAEYRVLRDARAVIFTCEEERRLAQESFWLYKVNERLAPLGTSEPPNNGKVLSEEFLSKYQQLRDKPFLLFLGRIHPKKGCDLLLGAFAANAVDHHNYHLVMAGPAEEDYLAFLQTQARSLGIEQRVHWIGMVKGDVKWGALHACDAFVLPSHQENFGIAVVEAMACSKPVLISDKVNIWREAAVDGCGLVGTDSLLGTSALLKGWLQLPETNRSAMAKQARQTYEQRYTVEASAHALLHAITS